MHTRCEGCQARRPCRAGSSAQQPRSCPCAAPAQPTAACGSSTATRRAAGSMSGQPSGAHIASNSLPIHTELSSEKHEFHSSAQCHTLPACLHSNTRSSKPYSQTAQHTMMQRCHPPQASCGSPWAPAPPPCPVAAQQRSHCPAAAQAAPHCAGSAQWAGG